MYVIYHGGCTDGMAAAAAAKKAVADAVLIPHFHGRVQETMKRLEEASGQHRQLYLLDCTLQDEYLQTLVGMGWSITVIDHHPLAREQAARGVGDVKFVTDSEDNPKSGAILAWEFFHPGDDMPQLFRVIGKRDIFSFDNEEDELRCLAITEGMSFVLDARNPEEFLNREDIWHGVDGLYDTGTIICNLHIKQMKIALGNRRMGAIRHNGRVYTAALVNCAPYLLIYSRRAWKELQQKRPVADVDVLMAYSDSRDLRLYQLRALSENAPHLGQLAQRWGGNGHPRAAGFQTRLTDEFPF